MPKVSALLRTVENLGGHVLVVQAGHESLFGETSLQRNLAQAFKRLWHPVLLRLEQHIDDREIFFLRCTARQHEAAHASIIVREFAEHQTHFAGVDVILLQLRQLDSGELRTMRAG